MTALYEERKPLEILSMKLKPLLQKCILRPCLSNHSGLWALWEPGPGSTSVLHCTGTMLRSWNKRTLESGRDVLSLTGPAVSCAYGAEEAQGGKGTFPPKVLGSIAEARGPSSHLLGQCSLYQLVIGHHVPGL